MSEHTKFLGTGWAFPPQFAQNNRTALLSRDEQDIQQSLLILLTTIPGERIMHPQYGCNLHRFVFAELNQTTLTEIKHCIKQAVLYFEPRINLIEILTQADATQERLILDLRYQIISTNTRDNLVYPFYLQEGTLIDQSLLPPDTAEF